MQAGAGNAKAPTRHRLVELLYARRRWAIFTFPPVAAILTAIEWDTEPHGRLLAWDAAVVAATMWSAALHWAYARRPIAPAAASTWARRATASALLNGIVLGSAGFLLFPDDPRGQAFLLLLIGGMTATAIATTSSHLPAYTAFLVAMLVPVEVRLFLFGDLLHAGMAALVLLHGGFMLGVARTGHRALVEAIELAAANRVLVEELWGVQADLERLVAERTGELNQAKVALRESEEQFRQAQKMEALGRLAGGVAHDFNNALAVIQGYCGLLLDRGRLEPDERKKLEAVNHAAEHAATLTKQLLAFSRRQVFQPRAMRLGEVVLGLEHVIRGLVRENIDLKLEVSGARGVVLVEPDQIGQVLINLVANARDAIADVGTIEIGVADTVIDDAMADGRLDARPGPHVVLWVRDSGAGMDEATKARLFEPFFTTKAAGQGTGLGLSNVYGIVKQSRGFLTVESRPGEGSTFKMFLPVTGASAATEPAEASSTRPTGVGTVLLVEDEESVRSMVGEVLRQAGFHLLEADGPDRAIELSRSHGGAIQIMVTDVLMPKMDGLQLARALAQSRPEMKVLYMSGYPNRPGTGEDLREMTGGFLQKPFSPKDLVAKVKAVLAGG